jgi:hypothetical protein
MIRFGTSPTESDQQRFATRQSALKGSSGKEAEDNELGQGANGQNVEVSRRIIVVELSCRWNFLE